MLRLKQRRLNKETLKCLSQLLINITFGALRLIVVRSLEQLLLAQSPNVFLSRRDFRLFHNALDIIKVVHRSAEHVSRFQLIRVDEALDFHVFIRDQSDELIDLTFGFVLVLIVSDLDGHGHQLIAHLHRLGIDDISFVGSIGFDRTYEFLYFHETMEILGEKLCAGRVDF
jgi:hypothetical protein